jgi:hypothetical protein
MPRLLLILLAALSMFAAACGDDDDSDATPTGSGTAVSVTATEDQDDTSTPEPDDKTPGPSESPGETTPAATAPGGVPTPGPSAPGGTPAVAPDDESEFLSQFEGQPFDQHDCAYNPATALTNCGADGLYSIDPPIVGQDPQCALLFFSEVPRVVQCHAIDAGGNPITRNYEITQ